MTTAAPLTPDEIDRLMADLDAGAYDEKLLASRGWPSGAAPLLRFFEVKPFDVKA